MHSFIQLPNKGCSRPRKHMSGKKEVIFQQLIVQCERQRIVYDKCFKFVSLHFRWVSNVCFPDFIIVQNYHTDSVHRYPHPPHFKMFIAQNSVEREHSFSKSFLSLVIFLQRKTVHILEVLSIKKIQGKFGNLQHSESFSASVPHQNHGTKKNDFFSVLPRKEQSQYHARCTGESLIYYILYSHILHHKCLCWKSQRPPPGLRIHLEDTQDSAHSPTHGYGLLQ